MSDLTTRGLPVARCGDCGDFLESEDVLVIHGLAGHSLSLFGDFLRAPFPWFGGKRLVSDVAWRAFGEVSNYVEPFFGSGAVLLGRPSPITGSETVNDKDGYVANFWRALQADPEAVAAHADNPVNENDLHARHSWLVSQKDRFVAKLEGDPSFHDAKVAGWWAWGVSCWIGSGFCSGDGPWVSVEVPGEQGVNRQLVHLSGEQGVNRKRVHLSGEQGVNRKLVHLSGEQGVNRKRQNLTNDDAGVNGLHRKWPNTGGHHRGRGVVSPRAEVLNWMLCLAERLRFVRVCCGDWSRICGPTPTKLQGVSAIFLDPPYSTAADRAEVYSHDDFEIANDVREWAISEGEDPRMRIALCGYEGEHAMPESWTVHQWKAVGGYEGQAKGERSGNSARERIWFSPHCMKFDQDIQEVLF